MKMIKYFLYCEDHPNGIKLAEVCDEASAHVLECYYRRTYDRPQYKITSKRPYSKEQWCCGGYGFKKAE